MRTRFAETDIVIVRENHEDLYAGVEYEEGKEENAQAARLHRGDQGTELRDDIGVTVKAISIFGSERIVEEAFEYAKANGRRKVTAVHKANIMKFSDGLFLESRARWLRTSTPTSSSRSRIVDNLCNQLVSRPEEYDVLVLPNLYGDIVSDLAAGMIGGLGVAPGANIGDDYAVFEATHGSAPKYKGQNKVNPTALMLSGVMLLRHIEEREAARPDGGRDRRRDREGERRDLRPEAERVTIRAPSARPSTPTRSSSRWRRPDRRPPDRFSEAASRSLRA